MHIAKYEQNDHRVYGQTQSTEKTLQQKRKTTTELLFTVADPDLETSYFSLNIFTQKREIRKEAQSYSLNTMWFFSGTASYFYHKKCEFVAETHHNTLYVFIGHRTKNSSP